MLDNNKIEDLLSYEPYLDWSLSRQRKLLTQINKSEADHSINQDQLSELKSRLRSAIQDWL